MSSGSKSESLYVQYGCGFSAPEGWINFDASPTVRIGKFPVFGKLLLRIFHPVYFPAAVRYGDIVKGLPVPDQSCSGLYCSHVLEHLSYHDFKLALQNSFRILKPGGTFRLVMPDLEALVQSYLDERAKGNPEASVLFVRNSLMGTTDRTKSLFAMIRANAGNEHHLWLWDHESTIHALSAAGFRKIRRCAFNDASDPMFIRVESADRFQYAVALECSA